MCACMLFSMKLQHGYREDRNVAKSDVSWMVRWLLSVAVCVVVVANCTIVSSSPWIFLAAGRVISEEEGNNCLASSYT